MTRVDRGVVKPYASRELLVAPRRSARADIVGRRDRTWRVREPRLDRRPLRRSRDQGQSDTAGRDDAQAGQWRTRQAVVRNRAGVANDGLRARRLHRPTAAGSRSPRSGSPTGASMRSRRCRRSPICSRRRPARATCWSMCTASTRRSRWRRSTRRDSPTASGSAARPWCSPGRRRRSYSITATTARARCGRATPWSRCSSGCVLSPSVGRIHVVAHSVGTMLTMEALRQLYARHGSLVAGADRRRGVRVAGYRHGRVYLLGRAHRPAGSEDYGHYRDERPRAGGLGVDRGRASPASAQPRRPGSSKWDCV